MIKLLVTGCAGFIGYHLCHKLLAGELEVIGIDNLNDYYDVKLKQARLQRLNRHHNFTYYQLDIHNRQGLNALFESYHISRVVNLAAQAGVRYSIENPQAYIDSNIVGFSNLLESCRKAQVQHLTYASSSSVYGLNPKIPFSTHDRVDHPISLYAATKKSNELMAHCYSHLYDIPTTGLRFFTVYGPWGRPDMAYFLFADKIMKGEPIQVFNHGKMKRDFTYIDDIVEGIVQVMNNPPKPNPDWDGNPSTSSAPYRIYNIGNNQSVELLSFIEVLEDALGKKAIKEMLPMQPGDVLETYADIDDLVRAVGFKPGISIEEGVALFAEWYKWYYNN